jgi:hypothetical protein
MKWVKDNPDLVLMWCWVALAIPTVLWWKESILWVALMSLYANFETSRSAHKARQAEKNKSPERG